MRRVPTQRAQATVTWAPLNAKAAGLKHSTL